MKKFTPHLVVLAVGVLSLALMSPNAMAQLSRCEHMHQISKVLNKQSLEVKKCTICVCEKMETVRFQHKIQASFLQKCSCDETNDTECGKHHGHPSSDTGEYEERGCIWAGGGHSNGIPGDSFFIANLTRVIKYCKDNDDWAGFAWPRAGYHSGRWKIIDSLTASKLASGKMSGCDGVDPSFPRPYLVNNTILWNTTTGATIASIADHHAMLPGGQPAFPPGSPEDPCGGGGMTMIDPPDMLENVDNYYDRVSSYCYIRGWQVGCITGSTTDLFYRYNCPPPATYDAVEVGNIGECTDGFVTIDYPTLEGKQFCVTPAETWKIKACYNGGNYIDPDKNPCEQWTDDWSVRLDGVATIRACAGGSGGGLNP